MSREAFASHIAEGRRLFALSVERAELDEGWRLRLPDDDRTATDCVQWILDERRCCPFLTFGLVLEPVGRLWLSISGPRGTKSVLRDALATEASGSLDNDA